MTIASENARQFGFFLSSVFPPVTDPKARAERAQWLGVGHSGNEATQGLAWRLLCQYPKF
jgi:hypothetical protein